VVEDDDSFRMALAEALRSLGYDAREFASAEAFIAGDVASDCVITDIRMPGMSGMELARILASRVPAVPVIMITAATERNPRARLAAGAPVCMLKKPFQTDALLECLHRALDGRPAPGAPCGQAGTGRQAV